MLFAFFEKQKLILKTTAVKNKRDRNIVRVIPVLKFFAFSMINFGVLYLITICFTFLFL